MFLNALPIPLPFREWFFITVLRHPGAVPLLILVTTVETLMALTPNEWPSNRHLDRLIDQFYILNRKPFDNDLRQQLAALWRAEQVAVHYCNLMRIKPSAHKRTYP